MQGLPVLLTCAAPWTDSYHACSCALSYYACIQEQQGSEIYVSAI
jgi:hypothetical protein